MRAVVVTGFTAEVVDLSAKTSKELQINTKNSKYNFETDEEVKVIADGMIYSGVVVSVMTIMIFVEIKSEKEVDDIVGKTVSYKDKTGVVIDINDFSLISDREAPEITDDTDFKADEDYVILQLNADRCYAKKEDVVMV